MSLPPRSLADDVARHSGWMARLARGLLGDPAAADDVVQEAWLRRGGEAARPGYLAAIVRSLASRWRRSEGRRDLRERVAARGEALPSAAEIAARSELAHLLAEAIEQLEEPYRTTLVLRYHDDLDAAEIARRAGIPAATVRARLKRGLDTLRARLDAREGGRERWLAVLVPWTRGSLAPGAAAGGSLLLLTGMKLALGSLVALAGLLFLWRAIASEPAREPLAPAARLEAPSGEGPGGEPALAAAAQSGRREALAPASVPAASSEPVPAAAQVRARVVDERGQPLRDAWLRLAHLPAASATGDGLGRVALTLAPVELERLAALDPERSVRVELGAPGWRTTSLNRFLPEGNPVLELGDVALAPGGAVHGRVVDEHGLGVEGALVVYGVPFEDDSFADSAPYRGPPDLDPQPWGGHAPALRTTSGPGGEFHLAGVPAGHGRAWARTTRSLWAFSAPIGVRQGAEVGGIELVARELPEAVLSGRVLDPEGRPLGGLELTFSESGGDSGWYDARTDAGGEFHFVPQGWAAVDIRARAPSWEWDDELVQGVEPGTHGLVIEFQSSAWLQVVVVDGSGHPVRDGRVFAAPRPGLLENPRLRAESPLDAHGHARIRRLDGPLRLRVEAPGYRSRVIGPLDPARAPEPVRVTLEAAPALPGRVLRADGRPAAGARVSLHRGVEGGTRAQGTPTGAPMRHLTHQGWGGDGEAFVYTLRVDPVVQVTADGEGRFRLPLPGMDGEEEGREEEALDGLGYVETAAVTLREAKPDSSWHLHAVLAGEATITSGPHVFAPDEQPELELRLPRGGAIAGRLVLEDGVSPAGWTMWASDGLAEEASAAVAADGTFELASLHPGGWQVRAFEPGKRHYLGGGRMATEREPVPDVEVVAGRTVAYEHRSGRRASARLAGRLTLDGAPAGAGLVIVRTSTRHGSITSHETTLDPDGRFELVLEPGLATTLQVHLARGGAQLLVTAKPVIVPGHNEWSADLPMARLEGRIAPKPEATEPFARGVSCDVEGLDVRVHATWTSGEDGRFGPLSVPAGRATLRRRSGGFGPGEFLAELELAAGETRTVTLP
ncbi:MAG TPA: sigma-70 family RNA polymerase sigma factor [Planctomycetota bacterium]